MLITRTPCHLLSRAADYTALGTRQAASARSSGSSGLLGAHFAAGSKTLQPSPTPRVYLGELQVCGQVLVCCFLCVPVPSAFLLGHPQHKP